MPDSTPIPEEAVCSECGHANASHIPETPSDGDIPGALATCSVCLDRAIDASRKPKHKSIPLFEKSRHPFVPKGEQAADNCPDCGASRGGPAGDGCDFPNGHADADTTEGESRVEAARKAVFNRARFKDLGRDSTSHGFTGVVNEFEAAVADKARQEVHWIAVDLDAAERELAAAEAARDQLAEANAALEAEIVGYVESKTRAFGIGMTYEHDCEMDDNCLITATATRAEAEWRAALAATPTESGETNA